MKKILLAIVICISYTGSSFALTMADVGGNVDILMAYENLENSGEAAETLFVKDYLGESYTKTDVDEINWAAITDDPTGSDVWAYDFGTIETDYFFIKTGNFYLENTSGTYDFYTHYLFENVDSLRFAVIDLAIFNKVNEKQGTAKLVDIGGVSHVGYTDAAPVPEPSTLLLLGGGLIGLAVYRRKKN